MDENMQQIDYNMLLMNHLNRISYITTSSFIDAVSNEMSSKYKNPASIGETSLKWGTHFLYCLVPDDLIDDTFKSDEEEYLKQANDPTREFNKLKAIINLLNRKGLLLSKQIPGRNNKNQQGEASYEY